VDDNADPCVLRALPTANTTHCTLARLLRGLSSLACWADWHSGGSTSARNQFVLVLETDAKGQGVLRVSVGGLDGGKAELKFWDLGSIKAKQLTDIYLESTLGGGT